MSSSRPTACTSTATPGSAGLARADMPATSGLPLGMACVSSGSSVVGVSNAMAARSPR